MSFECVKRKPYNVTRRLGWCAVDPNEYMQYQKATSYLRGRAWQVSRSYLIFAAWQTTHEMYEDNQAFLPSYRGMEHYLRLGFPVYSAHPACSSSFVVRNATFSLKRLKSAELCQRAPHYSESPTIAGPFNIDLLYARDTALVIMVNSNG